MGEKDYVRNFSDRDRLRVRFTARKGRVIAIEVIQYEAQIEGKWQPLVRFDTAHGYLHRDVMNPDGTQTKLRLSYSDLGQALIDAINEIERQWKFYRRVYEEKRERA